MPYRLAEIAARYGVYYYPIISSSRAFRALWKRAYHKFSELMGAVVYEDPWLAGGHNGLKSTIERLGTTEFARLRLGVGRGAPRRDLADHVLARFEPGERAELEGFITLAADAAEMFAVEGIEKVMNVYNPDATGPEID